MLLTFEWVSARPRSVLFRTQRSAWLQAPHIYNKSGFFLLFLVVVVVVKLLKREREPLPPSAPSRSCRETVVN